MTSPSSSENRDAVMNHAMVLTPMRPIDAVSPMCAMPDHQRREHQRRDDHLDQAQEDVGEQRDVAGGGLRRSPAWAAARGTCSRRLCRATMPMKIHVVSFMRLLP